MKNNLLKYYSVLVFFFSSVVLFAQPGDDDAGGTLEDTAGDTTPLPIDDYILVLAFVGLVFVFLRVKAIARQENTLKD
jgi:hypothetical protein